ncbi:hypothetical protein BDQ17DRAFT_754050 [Cyathus striatus]|nr:hypothetical protein BDQ17DRAFT_754050 [Cyathus striatus]
MEWSSTYMNLSFVLLRLLFLKDETLVEDDGKVGFVTSKMDKTLSVLLQSCYPSMTIATPVNIQDIYYGLRAAIKYQMTKVINDMINILKLNAPSQPFGVYFAFVRNGFIKEGAEVANNLLVIESLASLYHPVVERVSARSYSFLLEQRHRYMLTMLDICSRYENEVHPGSKESHLWHIMRPRASYSIIIAAVLKFRTITPTPSIPLEILEDKRYSSETEAGQRTSSIPS